MSISNPPIDNLSPFNPLKFVSYPTLTVDYLDSLFLSKRNTTESISPETIFQGLLKVANIVPNIDNAYTIGTALLRLLGVYSSTVYTNELKTITGSQILVRGDINLDYKHDINGVLNINVDNINNVNTAFLLINPLEVDINGNNKSITNINEFKATQIYTQSPVNPLNYSPLNYVSCEYMSGALYNLPSGPSGTQIPFKGTFTGFGASSLVAGAGYEIEYVMTFTSSVAFITYSVSTTLGATSFSTVLISVTDAGTYKLTYRLSFQVVSGTATTATIIPYASLKAQAQSEYQNSAVGSILGITGLVGGLLSPTFIFVANVSPANWSAARRGYSFIRKY